MKRVINCPNCKKDLYVLTKNQIEIIDILKNYGGDIIIMDIFKKINLSYKSTWENIIKLNLMGLIVIKKENKHNQSLIDLKKPKMLIVGRLEKW